MKRPSSDLGEWWTRFWFDPQPISTLSVLRIAYGVVLIIWTTALVGDSTAFFSDAGVLPERSETPYQLSIFMAVPDSPAAIAVVFAVLFVFAIAVTVGYRTRVSTAVAFVIVLSLQRRNPHFVNGGDALLRMMGLYIALSPAGAALSLDAWRRDRARLWSFAARAPWALRLLQIQISVLYLFAAWSKARGERWGDGTALATILRVGQYVRFDLPFGLTESLVLSNVLTYGTIAIELAIATLVWNRKARPWVLAAGILLHLLIEVTMALAFFGLVIVVSYIAFVPPDTMSAWLARARGALRRSRIAALRTLGEAR